MRRREGWLLGRLMLLTLLLLLLELLLELGGDRRHRGRAGLHRLLLLALLARKARVLLLKRLLRGLLLLRLAGEACELLLEGLLAKAGGLAL